MKIRNLFKRSINYFRNFDLFGIQPSLYFNGRKKSGTTFGLLLTFLFMVFTILCFFFFGEDLYYRMNPQLRYNEQYDPSPEKVVLDPEYFPVLIELNDIPVSVFYSETNILNVNVSQFSFIRQPNTAPLISLENYRMETCRPDHLDKLDRDTKNYFLNMNLKDYFCIPKNIKNLTMMGAFDQEVYQTIKFTISICNNASSNVTCLSSEDIKQRMNKGYIGIYFPDYNIKPGDYLNPKETQPKEVFTNWEIDSQKNIDIYFRNNYLETDDGILLQEVSKERITSYESYNEMRFSSEDPDFLMIYLKIQQKSAFYKRTYRKVQEVLAQIGGFINMFWILAFAVSRMYSKLIFVAEIITNVFRIRVFSNNRNVRRKKASSARTRLRDHEMVNQSITTRQNFRVKPFLDASLISMRGVNTDKKTYEEDLSSNREKLDENYEAEISMDKRHDSNRHDEKLLEDYDNLNLKTLDYIYFYTGLFKSREREKKKTIIIEGERILQKCLDVKYIIKKFYEIEKLKQLVLSQDDLKRFALMPKPELKISIMDSNPKGDQSQAVISTLVDKRLDTIVPSRGRLFKLNA